MHNMHNYSLLYGLYNMPSGKLLIVNYAYILRFSCVLY